MNLDGVLGYLFIPLTVNRLNIILKKEIKTKTKTKDLQPFISKHLTIAPARFIILPTTEYAEGVLM